MLTLTFLWGPPVFVPWQNKANASGSKRSASSFCSMAKQSNLPCVFFNEPIALGLKSCQSGERVGVNSTGAHFPTFHTPHHKMSSALNYITREAVGHRNLPIAFGRTVVTLAPGTDLKLNAKGRDSWYVNEVVHLQRGFWAATKLFHGGQGLQVKNWVCSQFLGRHVHGRVIRERFPHVVDHICFLVNDTKRFCRDTNQPAGRCEELVGTLREQLAGSMDLDKLRGFLKEIYPESSAAQMDISMRRVRVLFCDYLAVYETTPKARSMWLRERDGLHPPPTIEVSTGRI